MNFVYAFESPDSHLQSVFLAGPTPRMAGIKSWRPEAIEGLSKAGYEGNVLIPEPRDGLWHSEYEAQIEWEEQGLREADVILFWIPRDLEHLPGFTTNVEFGMWYDSGKVVLGYPPHAPKMKYLHYYAEKKNIPIYHSLIDATRRVAYRLNRSNIWVCEF